MKKLAVILLISSTFTSYGQIISTFQHQTDTVTWVKVYSGPLVGILDDNGLEVVPPIYDDIKEFGTHKTGWALIAQDGLFGFIDAYGNVAVEPQYEEIQKFGDYRTDWALVKKEGYYGFIDESGSEIVKPAYDHIEEAFRILKIRN